MNNVWIINQYTITPEYPASTRHYELAKYLADKHTVTLWGSNYIHHSKTFRFANKWRTMEEQVEGFNLVWLSSLPYKNNGILRMINMLIYPLTLLIKGLLRKERPDVIIGSSPPLLTAYAAMWVAKLRKAKFIFEVRDLWPDTLIQVKTDKEGFVVHLLRGIERSLYRRADLIIGLTEGIVQTIQQRGAGADKVVFLPNGMDLDVSVHDTQQMTDFRQKMRQQLGISQADKVFMYAGAHGPANDLSQLVEAAQAVASIPDIKIVLLGEGVEKQDLQRQAAELQLSHLIFLPGVPKSDIQLYLSIADAYLICLKDVPLYERALPNKIFDYMMQNKPIITTVPGEIRNFLEKYNLGFYATMKPNQEFNLPAVMKKIAAEVHQEPPYNHGFEIVRDLYSRKAQAEILHGWILQLIQRQ